MEAAAASRFQGVALRYNLSARWALAVRPPQNEPTNVQATALPGSDVRITYNKGRFAGVVVYSKRASEVNFSLLSVDTNTPYVDTRDPLTAGQPETRTYRLQLYDGDNPVGDYSDEVSVVTLP